MAPGWDLAVEDAQVRGGWGYVLSFGPRKGADRRRDSGSRAWPPSAHGCLTCTETALKLRRIVLPGIADSDRKGKVERGVGHAKNTPLKGMRFENLEEAQAYLDRWEANWADTRIHGTTKRQVASMFAKEKPALLPLPLEPFRH
jgi:hypothetical protein